MKIPDHELEALARVLLPSIQEYYNSPEGQAAFAQWKEQQAQKDKDKRDHSRKQSTDKG